MSIRRRLALWLCPDLANLPHNPDRHVVARRAPAQNHRKSEADELRRLDRLYAAHTGIVLKEVNAPGYCGPMYRWPDSPEAVRRQAIPALIRLRRSPEMGVQPRTHFRTLNYLAAIWPSDLEWPRDIPRPSKQKEAA